MKPARVASRYLPALGLILASALLSAQSYYPHTLGDHTGVLPVTKGGTGLNALGSGGQVLKVNAGGTALEFGADETGTGGGTFSGIGACGANQWASTLNDNAPPTCSQPGFSNLSGAVTDAQVPDNITVTLAATATALAANGGNCSGNTFALGVNASGVGECAQPAFSNLSGSASAAQLPNPGVGSKGGVTSLTCGGTDKISAIGTDGVPVCSADATGAGGGGPTILRVTADVTDTSINTWQDVTGLTMAVTSGTTYAFHCTLTYTTAATTTALQLSLNGPTVTALDYGVEMSTTATARHNSAQVAYDTVVNPATGGGAVRLPAQIHGTIIPSANGTLAVRMRTEIDLSAATVKRGSWCEVHTL